MKGTSAIKAGETLLTLRSPSRPSKRHAVLADLVAVSGVGFVEVRPGGEVVAQAELTKANMEKGYEFNVTIAK